jgi:hypothetical protein
MRPPRSVVREKACKRLPRTLRKVWGRGAPLLSDVLTSTMSDARFETMRTTLTLDPDVAERVRREIAAGKRSLKQVINEARDGVGPGQVSDGEFLACFDNVKDRSCSRFSPVFSGANAKTKQASSALQALRLKFGGEKRLQGQSVALTKQLIFCCQSICSGPTPGSG